MARTTVTPDLIHKIQVSYSRLRNCQAVADQLGIGVSTVSKYARSAPVGGDGASLDAAVSAALARLGVTTPKNAPGALSPSPSAPGALPGTVRLAGCRRVACIYDAHFPYHDATALDAALSWLELDFRPDLVILGGDALDCYSISRFSKSPDRRSNLQDELDTFAPYRDRIDALGAPVHWIDGNHEFRLGKLIAENPGLHRLRALDIPNLVGFPKRWKYHPNQTHIQIGNLVFLHGDLAYRGSSVAHAAAGMLKKLRASCVFGHLHRHQSYVETGYGGDDREAFATGHLSDIAQVDYIRCPDWQQGIAAFEFTKDGSAFECVSKRIKGGRILAGGKLY